MTNWEEVYKALHNWACEATGIAWVWANQDAPQVPRPFGVLNIISGPNKTNGLDERRFDVDCESYQTVSMREITVSFQVETETVENDKRPISPDCLSRAFLEKLLFGATQPTLKLTLTDAGLSIIDEQAIQNLDLEIADTMVSRSQMDIRFLVASILTDEQPTGIIEKVIVSSDWEGASDDLQLDNEQIGPVP